MPTNKGSLQAALANWQPQHQQAPGGSLQDLFRRQDIQRALDSRISTPSPPGSFVEDLLRRAEAIGGTYSPPVPSMSYPGEHTASIMPQGPPNLPGTGTAMVPPMPSGPPPRHPNVDRFFKQSAPPSRPQSWRPQGQRPAPATVGQTTTNPALQDRQRGGQSMARPSPQRGGLGIGGLGIGSAGPQRQGTGFMSGDVAWTTPQRPSGPSYYEGLMPGSTYSPMEQQRRR